MRWHYKEKLALNQFWSGKAGSNHTDINRCFVDYIIKHRKTKPSKLLEVTELSYLVTANVFPATSVLGKISSFRILLIDVEDGDREKMHSSASIFLQEKLKGLPPCRNATPTLVIRGILSLTAGGKHLRLTLRNAKQVRWKITPWMSAQARQDQSYY